jgi:hypothetical protein
MRGAVADMEKRAIDVAKALVRLSELTIFELRGSGGGFIACRRRCGSPATS